ncbi:hypothetical protein ACEZ3G_07790 [Maribacter algicola]|uniref:Uncharacterized protein n=1 Tax=Meishania litoralis TaxID=3434685 RepID=A0ACC7LHZ6_9FLAO
MAREKLEVIKEADLTNNCPECFNQDLKLTFYQKHLYGKLFHRTTGEITNKVTCNKCGSNIYPVKWTDDIERIFEYYQKMVEPEKASIRFTRLFYIIILLSIVLIAAAVYLYLQGLIQF